MYVQHSIKVMELAITVVVNAVSYSQVSKLDVVMVDMNQAILFVCPGCQVTIRVLYDVVCRVAWPFVSGILIGSYVEQRNGPVTLPSQVTQLLGQGVTIK